MEKIASELFKFLLYCGSVLISAIGITLIWNLCLSDIAYISYKNSVGILLIMSSVMHAMKFFYDLEYRDSNNG